MEISAENNIIEKSKESFLSLKKKNIYLPQTKR